VREELAWCERGRDGDGDAAAVTTGLPKPSSASPAKGSAAAQAASGSVAAAPSAAASARVTLSRRVTLCCCGCCDCCGCCVAVALSALRDSLSRPSECCAAAADPLACAHASCCRSCSTSACRLATSLGRVLSSAALGERRLKERSRKECVAVFAPVACRLCMRSANPDQEGCCPAAPVDAAPS
jgi:hypothetical protein